MSTHDEYMTRRQARDLARRLARLERKTRSTAAANDLPHSSIDDGVLKLKENGRTVYQLGTDPATGVTAPKYRGGPTPEQPQAPFVDVGGEVVKIQHSGLDVEENPAPADFRRAQIHVAQTETFAPSLSTLAGYLEEADGSFTHRLPGGEWYVGIVWETLSGKTSVMSEVVLADIPPLVDTQDLEDTLDAAEQKLNTYRDEVAAPRFQALETGLSESNDSLENARTRLSAAESTLAPLPGRIESAEENVATAQEEATKAAAAAVEANNRAMTRLANGNFESDLLYWDHDNVSLTSTAHSGQQAAQVSGWLRPGSSFPVVPEQIWELSLYHQYDVTVTFETVDGDQRATLSTHHLDGDSSWSDSGALRVTVPADVHMLSFTITGTSAIVDDITLRDVTDVVRLEEAANANRQKAEQAISELAVLQLAVDGEGGLKDRLTTAETTLETKADESALDQLDQKLAGDLAAFEAHYTRVWRQPTPPPPGTHYAWLGEPHASPSVRLDSDGNETARNEADNPACLNSRGWMRNTSAWDVTSVEIYDHPAGFTRAQHTIWNGSGLHSNNSLSLYDVGGSRIREPHALGVWVKSTVPATAYGQNTTSTPVEANVWTWVTFYRDRQIASLFVRPVDPSTIDNGTAEAWATGAIIVTGSEEYALSQVETYFDGDTASDRAHDLWYNQDGVPHEWVNGTNGNPGGWVELPDDRINQLQTDVVQAAETAYLDRLVVRDEIVTPETITNRLWADLGVFNRLQAREGWIGGTLLADGAITAEKIHATRELITKIMGAEWAYIAQQLIVDGKILTRDLEALSAAIQSLTVTQRADIAQLWAEELWTALAVIKELQAEEAWITSAMIQELTAEKVTVTEEFVARIGTFAEILGGKLWANEAFIDRMAASEAYFGSSTANYQTIVNGLGMHVTSPNLDDPEGPRQTMLQIGAGGENTWANFDPTTGETLSSIGSDGAASFQMIDSTTDPTIAGRRLVGGLSEHAASHHASGILDAIGWGEVAAWPREATPSAGPYEAGEIGLIQVNFEALPGRQYEIHANAGHIARNGTTIMLRLRYTDNDLEPDIGSTLFHQEGMGGSGPWHALKTTARFQGDPDTVNGQPKPIRVLMSIQSTSAWSFVTGTGLRDLELSVKDVGPIRAPQGADRSTRATSGGAIGGKKQWTTAWRASSMANYQHQGAQRRTGGTADAYLTQGQYAYLEKFGIQSSLTWFNGQAIVGEVGTTLTAAMAGAQLDSGILDVYNAYEPTHHSSRANVYWHEYTSAPSSMSVSEARYIGEFHVPRGGRGAIQLPPECLEAIQNGTFAGFAFYTTSPEAQHALGMGWDTPWQRPNLVLNYQR